MSAATLLERLGYLLLFRGTEPPYKDLYAFRDALVERSRFDEEHERERMKLAACGVAAICNTVEGVSQQSIPTDSPYYSASYADVRRAVDEQIALRVERDRYRSALKGIEEKCDGFAKMIAHQALNPPEKPT